MTDACPLRRYTDFNRQKAQLSRLYIAAILSKMTKHRRILLDPSSGSSPTGSQKTILSSRSSCSEGQIINYWTFPPVLTTSDASAHRVHSEMFGSVRTDWMNSARSIDQVSFTLGHPFFASPMSVFSASAGTTAVFRARSRAAFRNSVRFHTWRSQER